MSAVPASMTPSALPLLSSRRNPLVRQLRQLHEARGRREQGLLLLEGTHLLQEAARLGLQPRLLLATPAWIDAHAALLQRLAVRPQPVTPEVLEFVATTNHPDGVLAALEPPCAAAVAPQRALAAGGAPGLWLALDTIQDPGNLGTLMRTALAAEVAGLWLADGADPHQPKVLRSSAGAALALPLWRGERAQLCDQLRAALQPPPAAGRSPVQLVATVPPEQGGLPYWQLDWRQPTVLMLGSEGAGLAPELLALATDRVTIPHGSAVESLNVAVAAAPLLLERQRQRATVCG